MKDHVSVMPEEVIAKLNTKKDEWVVDCNLGLGGHTYKVLSELGSKVIGIDLDANNISRVRQDERFFDYLNSELFLENTNFTKIEEVVAKNKLDKVDAVLFDLGLTLNQYKNDDLGFGFESDNLDMRLDKSLGVTAKDLILALGYKELAVIFEKFGGETDARRLAKIIKDYVKVDQDITADKLTKLIERNAKYNGKYNPATRIFQALRIAVNDELGNLTKALESSVKVLKLKGRILVITFHNLEEKTVKDFIESNTDKVVLLETLKPSLEERYQNQSSRSATLFILEKQ